MSFQRAEIARLLARHGPLMRVVVASHHGSTPREAGAAMLVWPTGQAGTIGGGALEHAACARARRLAETGGAPLVERLALGPAMGQCCGGAVTLVYEYLTAATLAGVPQQGAYARAVTPEADEMPLALRRAQARARGEGVVAIHLAQGWLIEPITRPDRHLWIWGAGHVGRALVEVLHPLPGFALTWVDFAPERFPPAPADGVCLRHAPDPASLVPLAPVNAEHLILTYSHALDLDLCHRLLRHGFGWAGLIGSASKWARFQNRLRALGHDPRQIRRFACPIGDPALGKHPQAIAIGVAQSLLATQDRAAQSAVT